MTEQMPFHPNPATQPLWQPALTSASSLATVAQKSIEPVLKQTTQTSADTLTFAAKRASAWADHGRRLATCKQPSDLVGCQQAFWQQSVQDYTEFNRTIMNAWMGMIGAVPSAWPMSQTGPAPARDIISFRDPVQEQNLRETDPRSRAA